MDEKITAAFERLRDACRKLSAAGYPVEDDMSDPEKYMRFCVTKLLTYLTMTDRQATDEEIGFINDLLGLCLERKDVVRLGGESLTANSVTESFHKLCAVFAKAQAEGKTDISCGLFMESVNTIGIGFIAADGKADERETAILGSLIFRLRIFCDSYLKTSDKNKHKADGGAAADTVRNTKKSGETLEELMEQLHSLVGLEGVKKEIYSLSNLIKVRKMREERGFRQPEISLHLVFTGNPGTGKTTVARLIAKIYNRLGAIRSDTLVEVDRSGLVSGYVGQTALKTQKVCESALGGVLFIDEAYALTSAESKNDFGMEAVNTLLKFMEDHRDDLVVICAGYTQLMEEFLESNPGLRSRFNRFIHFDDYNAEQLTKIFMSFCGEYGLDVSREAVEYVNEFFGQRCGSADAGSANARDVRNFFEKTISRQADRIAGMENVSDEQLMSVTAEDVRDIDF